MTPQPAGVVLNVLIEWSDNSTDEDGFVLRYRKDGDAWSEVDVTVDTTSYRHEQLTRGTRYTYAVCAYNEFGRSWWSEELIYETPELNFEGGGCALVLEQGTASFDSGGPVCVWVCSTDQPSVIDHTRAFGASPIEVLRGPGGAGRVAVGGRGSVLGGLARFDLQVAVLEHDMPVGTIGEVCLLLHDPAAGPLPGVLERVGFRGRPVLPVLNAGLHYPVRAGQHVPVTVTIDHARRSWSVAIYGVQLVGDAPLDAIVTVPAVVAAG